MHDRKPCNILSDIDCKQFDHKMQFQYLADELEVSQKYISRLENGETSITVEQLLKLSEILQVHYEQLIYFNLQKIEKKLQTFEQNLNLNDLKSHYERIISQKDQIINKLEQLISLKLITDNKPHS